MADVPLPATCYVLGVPGDGYTDDRCTSFPAWDDDAMHAHAAAVTAAKDAEIAALRKALWKIVHLRPDIEHPPLHSEAEGIRILARAALGDKND